jgi:HSP20 family protein
MKENSMDVTETLVRELKSLYQTVTGQPFVKPAESGVGTRTMVDVPRGTDPVAHLYTEVAQLRQMLAHHPAFMGKVRPTFTPALDARHEGETIVLRLELPGVAREDVQILVFDRMILVRGERKAGVNGHAPEVPFVAVERWFGPFERVITFVSPIQNESIRARLHDGILEIQVPRQTGGTLETSGRRIEID